MDEYYKKLPCRRCGQVWKWSLDKKSVPFCPRGHGCAKEELITKDSKMKFIRHSIDGTKIEVEIHDDSSLDEVLEEFQNFLRACGYMIEYNQCLVLGDMDK